MSPVAGVLVYFFVNKIEFEGQVDYIATFLKLTKRSVSYNLPGVEQEEPEKEKFLEEFVFAVCVAITFVMVIALMESEVQKRNQKLSKGFTSPFKDNNGQNNNSFRIRSGFLTKKVKVPSLLTSIDLTKQPVLITGSNVSQVFNMLDKESNPVSVFKPYDEVSENTEKLILSRKQHAMNEVAAYRVDQLVNTTRANVPETRHVKLPGKFFNTKSSIRGSLQKFVQNGENCEDYGPSVFKTNDVQNIGVLDIKILNCDRHTGNILFNPEEKRLTPIDHALSFPEIELFPSTTENATFAEDMISKTLTLQHISFDWLMFKQAKLPFSEEMLSEIKNLNVLQHLQLLAKLGMNSKQQLAVFSSMTLLQIGALQFKKTLYEIGSMVQRQGSRKQESVLEQLIEQTLKSIDRNKIEKKDVEEIQKFCENFREKVVIFLKV